MSGLVRIDPGSIEAHHRGCIGAVAEFVAIASGDVDLVADGDILEESEVRIAMRRIDGDAGLSCIGCALDMSRTEGERLAAAACQHDGAGMDPLDLDPRDRPGV